MVGGLDPSGSGPISVCALLLRNAFSIDAKLFQRPAARQQNQEFLAARKGDRKLESVAADANDFDVAGDRGNLAAGVDREVTIELAQRGVVLRIKLNAICHTGVKS